MTSAYAKRPTEANEHLGPGVANQIAPVHQVSFAKTRAAFSSVTVVMIRGARHSNDREGGFGGTPGDMRLLARMTLLLKVAVHGTDEVSSGSASFVAMVETADFWEGHHVTVRIGLHASRRRRVFRQREVSSRGVIVGEVAGQLRCKCLWLKTITWSRHSRRMDPIRRST
jgi:hypothetical protein